MSSLLDDELAGASRPRLVIVPPPSLPAAPTVPSPSPAARATRPDPAEAPPATDIDWPTVVALRRRAADVIADQAAGWSHDHGAPMPETDRRLMGRSVIRGCVRDHVEQLHVTGQALWPLTLEQSYARAVENAIFGFGRLQPLFEQPGAENIEIHGFDSVFIQDGDGRRHAHPPVADSDDELVEAI
ncbi:MAG: hypothetical protein FWF28_10080, partial [Micrococcales bacterium]|nr:hypothetical protein [Micrococcales bacterium]